jgi:dolichol-phosphate mannosyltransferase
LNAGHFLLKEFFKALDMNIPRIFIVLPAYNEDENLRPLLSSLEGVLALLRNVGHGREYVIVDDGSLDTTPDILREFKETLPIHIITHNPNLGLGATVRDGLRRASEIADREDIVFTMDADNSHPAGLIIPMTHSILAGNDVVIASRYRPGSRIVGLAWHRKFMSTGAKVLFQLLFPMPGVRDYTCGYRAYRAELLKEAFRVYGNHFVEHEGFQSMADILLKLNHLGAVMSEVQLILRYDRKKGQSKMRVGLTVLNTLRLMFQWRFIKHSPSNPESMAS